MAIGTSARRETTLQRGIAVKNVSFGIFDPSLGIFDPARCRPNPDFWGGFPPKPRSVLRNRQGIPRLSGVSSRARGWNTPRQQPAAWVVTACRRAPAGKGAAQQSLVQSTLAVLSPDAQAQRRSCCRLASRSLDNGAHASEGDAPPQDQRCTAA